MDIKEFTCPVCKGHTIERLFRDVTDTNDVDIVNGEIVEGKSWMDYGNAADEYEYYCKKCGYQLPVDDLDEHYSNLIEYLNDPSKYE